MREAVEPAGGRERQPFNGFWAERNERNLKTRGMKVQVRTVEDRIKLQIRAQNTNTHT